MKYVKDLIKEDASDVDEFLLDEDENPLEGLPEAVESEEEEEDVKDENGEINFDRPLYKHVP
jgi:hypothetical protein